MLVVKVITIKIKGTACSLYNVYTVITASHGITAWLWYIREVIPWLGSYTMGSYKVLVYIVQATYTILEPYHGLHDLRQLR